MTDLARIAEGLSEGQKAAIRGRILHITKRDVLVGLGILTPDGGRNWTPLGLAVRRYLMEQTK